MSGPKRIVRWSPAAKGQLRAIDRTDALRILRAIDAYLLTGVGDVKKLRPPSSGFRFRVGDYRILFRKMAQSEIGVRSIKHRSQAYH